METIGDSVRVDEAREEYEKDSIEFERNLDVYKKNLDREERRLTLLEERRAKLENEIEEMYKEILEEKNAYRQAIGNAIEEREKISRSFIENCIISSTPVESATSLLNECQSATEDLKLDCNFDLEMEKIRSDLMAKYITTKEGHLSTANDQIQQLDQEAHPTD